jgi:hypothetical protein
MSSGDTLEERYPFLTVLHPAHLEYIRDQGLNTLDFFLELLDGLPLEYRDDLLGMAYMYAQPNMGYPPGGRRPMNVEPGETSYEGFKARCREAARAVSEPLLVMGLVHGILNSIFTLGDPTTVEEKKTRLVELAESPLRDKDSPQPSDADMRWMVDHIENLPEQAQRYYERYTYFCEHVVRPLMRQWGA